MVCLLGTLEKKKKKGHGMEWHGKETDNTELVNKIRIGRLNSMIVIAMSYCCESVWYVPGQSRKSLIEPNRNIYAHQATMGTYHR